MKNPAQGNKMVINPAAGAKLKPKAGQTKDNSMSNNGTRETKSPSDPTTRSPLRRPKR